MSLWLNDLILTEVLLDEKSAAMVKNRRSNRRKKRQYPVPIVLFVLVCVCLIYVGVQKAPELVIREVVPKEPEWAIQQHLTVNKYSRPGYKLEAVKGVVVHYVANPNSSASSNRAYFEGLATTGATHASSHFIIGLEGEVIQCIPLNEMSYASNQRNRDTISIEVCHPDESGRFNPATYDALVRLVNWICYEYGLDRTKVIRHHDVTGKNCPKFFVDYPEEWEKFLDQIRPELLW